MSMPAIFFTADDDVAAQVRLNHNLPHEDVSELTDMDILKMATLWAIMDNKEYDDSLCDEFESIYESEEEWTFKLPNDLVQKLSKIIGDEMDRVCHEWAQTEEMSCSGYDALTAFIHIRPVAQRAVATNRSMYLYTSL